MHVTTAFSSFLKGILRVRLKDTGDIRAITVWERDIALFNQFRYQSFILFFDKYTYSCTFVTSSYPQPLKDKYPNFEVGLKSIVMVF